MSLKHDPFEWVHSGFGYVATMIVATLAFMLKKEQALSTFLEFLIAINGLFWLKQYTNRKVESDTQVKIAALNGGTNGKTGDPLS